MLSIGTGIQAILKDILEAAEHAQTMSTEEIEETIRLIVDEVRTMSLQASVLCLTQIFFVS